MDRATEGRALAAGLVIDGVPESVALGLTIAHGAVGPALLAGAGDAIIGAAQAVAAGAVLAGVSITVVPETFRDIARRVATALIAGFVFGYVLAS